ncbi:MAG: hypothetical protein ACOYN0_05605, partial [Phycisphaerales bacterium]
QLASSERGVPMTSFFFDPEYRSSAFGRLQSGVDTAEGATHPSTVLDVSILARQLLSLPRTRPVVVPGAYSGCPGAPAVLAASVSPLPDARYAWEIERADQPGTFDPLVDGPLVRRGVVVAGVRGAASATLTLSGLSGWHNAGWVSPGRGSVRLVETIDGRPVRSMPIQVSVCATDFNCSGGVDGDDVVAFVTSWDVGAAESDFNGSGGVDGDDVIDFFESWDRGC